MSDARALAPTPQWVVRLHATMGRAIAAYCNAVVAAFTAIGRAFRDDA